MAMLGTDTGEAVQKTLEHEDDKMREFYSALRGPVQVGIEATGSMWDWRVGKVPNSKIELAVAVGGSSAFPAESMLRKRPQSRLVQSHTPSIAHGSVRQMTIGWPCILSPTQEHPRGYGAAGKLGD
jgi:hypothetical protein